MKEELLKYLENIYSKLCFIEATVESDYTQMTADELIIILNNVNKELNKRAWENSKQCLIKNRFTDHVK